LDKSNFKDLKVSHHVEALKLHELDCVVELYKKVFPGFPSKKFMADKLTSDRGIGYRVLLKETMLSVAQSDFGNVIVGVATDPSEQNKGLARACMSQLLKDVLEHHEAAYLQYDNLEAGRLYEKFGFRIVDQVNHYVKR
jgi:predicted GNAT family acetyltransferase